MFHSDRDLWFCNHDVIHECKFKKINANIRNQRHYNNIKYVNLDNF